VSMNSEHIAYDDLATIDVAKVAVFAGSILSGLIGALILIALAGRTPSRGAPG
jgi:Na+/H+ antiporter NhaA